MNEKTNELISYAQQISNEEYHSRPCLSATGLKQFLKSPAHYRAFQDAPSVDTPAFRFGRMAHSAVLEPATFSDLYQTFEGDRRKKEGKAEWKRILDEGAEPIKPEEEAACVAINRACGKYFPKPGVPELSFSAEINGVLCQARPDWVHVDDDGNVSLFDLKTTTSIDGFERDMYKFKYHIQDCFYFMVLDAALPSGFEIGPIQFVAVEKNAPHDVMIRKCDRDIWALTMNMITEALGRYRECSESGVWPGVEGETIKCKEAPAPSYIVDGMMPSMDDFYSENCTTC